MSELSKSPHDPAKAALAGAVVAVLAGAVAGWFVGDWIASAIERNNLGAAIGAVSFVSFAAAFAKDGLLALIDLGRSFGSDTVQEEHRAAAVATLLVVSFLVFASFKVFWRSADASPTPTSCEQMADAQSAKSGDVGDVGHEASVVSPALVFKCMRADVLEVRKYVERLARKVEKLDGSVARIDARVSPCPFLFENAKLEGGGEARLEGSGVCLEEAHRARLSDLADRLAELARRCALTVKVTGYASEAPFRNVPASDSKELNRQAANQRGASVALALRRELRERGVGAAVNETVWKEEEWGKESMRPRFADGNALEQRDRWLIGRSVFIDVAYSETCDPGGQTTAARHSQSRAAAPTIEAQE